MEVTNTQTAVLKSKKKLFPLLFLFGLLLLGLLFYLFTNFGSWELPTISEVREKIDEKTEDVGPTGEIYLTLSPLGTEKPNIYKLDVESMELEEFLPNEEGFSNFMAKFSIDGNKMAFVRSYEENKNQLMVYNLSDNTFEELVQTDVFFPRNPSFSSNGDKVVYWILEKDLPIGDVPEDNYIYIISLDGNVKEKGKIANGAFPQFSPDGEKIIYLKSDGLYTMELGSSEEVLVLELDTTPLAKLLEDPDFGRDLPSWSTLRFDVSDTGESLIITDTLASKIFIFNIVSWNNFEYEFISELDFYIPNWPVFSTSANGRFFATQEFESEDVLSSQIAIFDRDSNFDRIGAFGLSNYDPNYIWVTDWISK